MGKGMLIAIATVLLGGVAAVYLLFPRTASETVSAREAEEAVIAMYGGQVESSVLEGQQYKVVFDREDGRYTAFVDQDTGRVKTIETVGRAAPAVPEKPERLTEEQAGAIAVEETGGKVEQIRFLQEQNEYEVRIEGEASGQLVILSAESGEIRKISPIEADAEPEADPVLTEAQAVEIAKKTLDGEVQEVVFTDDSDGGFYLIELENDELDKEVTVQIHAVRGETLTVEWDD